MFPAMEKAGIPGERGSIGVMLYEHKEGRDFVKGMIEAVAKYKKGGKKAGREVARNARNYVSLLSRHIARRTISYIPWRMVGYRQQPRRALGRDSRR